MTTFTLQVPVKASPQKVWGILADFGNIQKWSPTVKASHSTSAATTGLGATRHCDLIMSGAMLNERIVRWEEGRHLTSEIYEMTGMPGVKSPTQAAFTVAGHADGSLVTMEYSYQLKFGPLGAVLDALMMRGMMIKAMRGLLGGLKHYAETGRKASSESELPVAAVSTA